MRKMWVALIVTNAIWAGLASAQETTLPDVPCDRMGGTMSTGFHQYIAKQISPGHCRWIEDIEGENSIAQYEAKKLLYFMP